VISRELVADDPVYIFDVGAHIGQTALRYRTLFPAALIHCFEPYPDSFEQLVAATGRDKSIIPHRLALAESAGVAHLNVNRSSATNSLLPSDARASLYWGADLLDTRSTVEIQTETVDRMIDLHVPNRLHILKLDVQGAERSALEGASRSLERQAVDLVYMEIIMAPTYVSQPALHEHLAWLDARGYVLFDLYNTERRNGRLIQADALFASRRLLEKHEASLKT